MSVASLNSGLIPSESMHVCEVQLVLIQVDPAFGLIPLKLGIHSDAIAPSSKTGAKDSSPLWVR